MMQSHAALYLAVLFTFFSAVNFLGTFGAGIYYARREAIVTGESSPNHLVQGNRSSLKS